MWILRLRRGNYLGSLPAVTFYTWFDVCVTFGEQKLLVAHTNNNASLDYLTRRPAGLVTGRTDRSSVLLSRISACVLQLTI